MLYLCDDVLLRFGFVDLWISGFVLLLCLCMFVCVCVFVCFCVSVFLLIARL